jgi:hypothetical protein
VRASRLCRSGLALWRKLVLNMAMVWNFGLSMASWGVWDMRVWLRNVVLGLVLAMAAPGIAQTGTPEFEVAKGKFITAFYNLKTRVGQLLPRVNASYHWDGGQKIWLAGDGGTILSTSDAGMSWRHVWTGTHENLVAIVVILYTSVQTAPTRPPMQKAKKPRSLYFNLAVNTAGTGFQPSPAPSSRVARIAGVSRDAQPASRYGP